MKRLTLIASLALVLAGCHKESFDERVARECKEYTAKYCPADMDENMKLDSLSYDIKQKVFTHSYRLSGPLAVDSVYTDNVRQNMEEIVLDDLKESITLRPYKEAGLTFRFVYYNDQTGCLIMEFIFTPKDYCQMPQIQTEAEKENDKKRRFRLENDK